ncbi:sphingosine N-acyltransferase lag1 [Entomortierella beljakovae]|nr:sphingosine N-acyltransferase lag1 [Entomortierella beljakovae]
MALNSITAAGISLDNPKLESSIPAREPSPTNDSANVANNPGRPNRYDHRERHEDVCIPDSALPASTLSKKIPRHENKPLSSEKLSWAGYLVKNQLVLSSSVVIAVFSANMLNLLYEQQKGHHVDWIASFSAIIPPPVWSSLPLSWTQVTLGGPAVTNGLNLWEGQPDPNEYWTSLTFALQYRTIKFDESTGQRQVLYGKGWNDLYMLLVWIMIWTAIREGAMTYLFLPLGRQLGVGGSGKKSNVKETKAEEKLREGKILRFAEQGWLVLYDGCMWTFGFYLLYKSSYFTDTTYYWRDYPNMQVEATMKWYYLVQLGFWFQQICLALLGIEKRRKDFAEFMIHHVITCLLVGFSYIMNFTSIGHAVFCTMDFSDIVLAVCKMLKYAHYDSTADKGFVFFVVTWILSRHVFYGVIVWSTFSSDPYLAQMGWDPSNGQFLTLNVLRGFQVLLVSLYAVLMFWLVMMLRVVIRVFKGQNVEDVRSDDDGEEEVQQPVEKVKSANNKHEFQNRLKESPRNSNEFNDNSLSQVVYTQGNRPEKLRSRVNNKSKSHAM